MTAFPDTMRCGSGKKSERSKMRNTWITSKKNSGSPNGMKMKVTHRGRAQERTPHTTQRPPPLFFPAQKFRWLQSLLSSPIYDIRLTTPSMDLQFQLWILLHLRLLFCTAKFKTGRVDFFFNCLNLTFRIAFVFDLADFHTLGQGLSVCTAGTLFPTVTCANRVAIPACSHKRSSHKIGEPAR